MPFVFQHGLCGDADQLIQVFPEDTGYRGDVRLTRSSELSECWLDQAAVAVTAFQCAIAVRRCR